MNRKSGIDITSCFPMLMCVLRLSPSLKAEKTLIERDNHLIFSSNKTRSSWTTMLTSELQSLAINNLKQNYHSSSKFKVTNKTITKECLVLVWLKLAQCFSRRLLKVVNYAFLLFHFYGPLERGVSLIWINLYSLPQGCFVPNLVEIAPSASGEDL